MVKTDMTNMIKKRFKLAVLISALIVAISNVYSRKTDLIAVTANRRYVYYRRVSAFDRTSNHFISFGTAG
jgi:hypothetical protein